MSRLHGDGVMTAAPNTVQFGIVQCGTVLT
jgi:hypothetical protein